MFSTNTLQVSDIHRKKGDHKYEKGKKPYEEGDNSADYNAGLPVVAFTFSENFKKDYPHIKQVRLVVAELLWSIALIILKGFHF